MKRVFSIFICLFFCTTICSSMLAIQVKAASPETDFNFNSATGTITGYVGSGGAVEIPSTIRGFSVKAIGNKAFSVNSFPKAVKITSMVIPAGVASIGYSAFAKCAKLTHVDIPDSVKSIGVGAFADCSALTSISIPYGITSILMLTFDGCQSLINADIPNSVTILGDSAFADCSSLKSITLPENLTRIGNGTFWYCTSLTNVKVPNSVTFLGQEAFAFCDSLESIMLSRQMTTLEVSTFKNCSKLSSIEIPDSITSIGMESFTHCVALKSIIIPKNVNEIDSSAFDGCITLSSAYFMGNAPEKWQAGVFDHTAPVTIFYFSENNGFNSPLFNGYKCVCLYRVDVKNSVGGRIAVASHRSAAGNIIIITVTPDRFKAVTSLSYIDKNGRHAISRNSFVMPFSDVIISAQFGWAAIINAFFAFSLAFLFGILGYVLWLIFRNK